jgi:hypothetical protein
VTALVEVYGLLAVHTAVATWAIFAAGAGARGSHSGTVAVSLALGAVWPLTWWGGGACVVARPKVAVTQRLAGQQVDRLLEVLVGEVGVAPRRLEGGVPREDRGQREVFGPPVEVRDGGVAERMEVDPSLEASQPLPLHERSAELTCRQSVVLAAGEERRIGQERVAPFAPMREVPLELGAQGSGQPDNLHLGIGVRFLEDAELDDAACPEVCVEHVTDVEREDLMLAQPCTQGEGVDDVVSPSTNVLSGRDEESALLALRERGRRADEAVQVVSVHQDADRNALFAGHIKTGSEISDRNIVAAVDAAMLSDAGGGAR